MNDFGSFLNPARVRGTSSQPQKKMYARIFDADIAFVTQQLTRGEKVVPFNAVSNINSIVHTNIAIRILFWCQKD